MVTLAIYLLCVLAVWLFSARQCFVVVRGLRSPEQRLIAIENGREVLAKGTNQPALRAWAESHGFEPDCMYDFFGGGGKKRITQSNWVHAEKQIALSAVEAPNKGILLLELWSTFEGDITLTTSGSRASLLFPLRPGRYLQALKNNNLDSLLIAHEEAIDYLQAHRNVSELMSANSDYEKMLEGQRKQGTYIESLPLWPLRAPYWYFFRQYYYYNKTIAQQYPS